MTSDYLNEIYDLNDPALVSIIDELPLWSAPFGLKLLDKVMFHPNMNVLDLGCGLGFPLLELANRLGDNSDRVSFMGLAGQRDRLSRS